jgi:hypothetical protein
LPARRSQVKRHLARRMWRMRHYCAPRTWYGSRHKSVPAFLPTDGHHYSASALLGKRNVLVLMH